MSGAAPAAAVPVAVVPTAPLLLGDVSPRQPVELTRPVAQLRAAIATTLATTLAGRPQPATVVLLAGGAATEVVLGCRVDRTPSGHPQATADLALHGDAAHTLATAADLPATDAEVLAGDLGVLAALVADVRPGTPLVPVTVAVDTDLAAVATVLQPLAAEGGWAVVAAGDLAATREVSSPGYIVDGAVAFDDAVVAALRAGDGTALGALGPSEAGRVQARGWAPLVVAAEVAARPFVEVALTAPRGVGQVVASTEATGVRLQPPVASVPA